MNAASMFHRRRFSWFGN